MRIVGVVGARSTCTRRSVGAVAVRDKRILATGYNGAVKGLDHCTNSRGCLREQLGVPSGERHELCRGVHAEQNLVIQCAIHGVSMHGSTVYASCTPCVICTKLLLNVGVRRIVTSASYPDEFSLAMIREARVELDFVEV